MEIVSANERAKRHTTVSGLIVGNAGIGKTTLLYSLEGDNNLFVNLESGELAVKDWTGGTEVVLHTWAECQDLAVVLAGPDIAVGPNEIYSQAHYDHAMKKDYQQFLGKDTIFIDSFTEAASLCGKWANQQKVCWPKAPKGNRDDFKFWGLLKYELINFAKRMQRVKNTNVWLLALLQREASETGYVEFTIQFESKKAALALDGIFDQIITMEMIPDGNGEDKRTFCTKRPNPKNYLAKDRSGVLNTTESANLGALISKIKGTNNCPSQRVHFDTHFIQPTKET